MIKKLRAKFVLVIMLIVTVMLAIIFGMVLYFTQSNMEQESIQSMHAIAALPVQHGRHDSAPPDGTRMSHFIVEITPEGDFITSGNSYYNIDDNDFISSLVEIARKTDEQTGVIDEHKLRFCRIKTPVNEKFVFADVSVEYSVISNLVRNCVIIGVISFAVFLAISVLLSRWMVKPVEEAWSRQRQFIANASHELKTPLTVIITNAEMLENPEFDVQKRNQFINGILAMSTQMKGLVEDLLELARVDNGTAKMTFSELDFSNILSEELLSFEALYYEKGLELNSSIENGIHVKGDSSYLRRTADILLDNAMKYSSADSKVFVKLAKSGSNCIFSVRNCGESISQSDLKNIFKRFYRVDKARSMNHSYGLGLSIAESIVKEHHGKIWAESADGVNTFNVKLSVSVD